MTQLNSQSIKYEIMKLYKKTNKSNKKNKNHDLNKKKMQNF